MVLITVFLQDKQHMLYHPYIFCLSHTTRLFPSCPLGLRTSTESFVRQLLSYKKEVEGVGERKVKLSILLPAPSQEKALHLLSRKRSSF